MLWSVLQESDVFQNIPNEKFNDVRNNFEKSLLEFSKNNAQNDIVAMNKEVIPVLLSNVNTISNSNLNMKQNKKIEVIYKADEPYRVEDLHKQRADEFNNKFQEQQSNMNELLQPKKPKEVSFADKAEDKPLGGDMDKLIQEMLTSRERELEVISASSENNISDAKAWLKSSATKAHDQGTQDQGTQDQGTHDQGTRDQGTRDKGTRDQGTQEQGTRDQGTRDQDAYTINESTKKDMPPTNKNFVSVQSHPISEIVLEPAGIQYTTPPGKSSFMNKFKKKDPIKDLADEVKELKQNQVLIMEQITHLINLLEKKYDTTQEK